MSTKKYKLHKCTEASGENKPICAFFTSPDGCRNGANCKFLHGPAPPVQISETASVVSSESEPEPPKSAKKKNQNDKMGTGNKAASTPKAANSAANENSNKKRKAKNENQHKSGDDIFANPKDKDHAPDPPAKRPRNSDKKPPTRTKSESRNTNKRIKTENANPSSSCVDFRSLISTLPIASFSIPGVNDDEPSKQTEVAIRTEEPESMDDESAAEVKPENILPTSEAGKKWIKAIEFSRRHERYASFFDYARCKEAFKEAGLTSEWIKAKPYGPWCANNPQAIAIDCEMCETQDPLSGAKNSKALCRISVVDADKPGEVLLDTLVKPMWPVTDYRTRINGISKEDLEKVEFTLRHAQAFMMALCSEETVIVGHAVQNDLVSLNMEHHCVADSSFLFHAKDSTSASVSLKDLVQSIFKKEMPETHDSVNDARKALECVMHWVENDGNVETIERTAKHKGNQLFVHRIPKQCKPHHLTTMFLKHTSVEPTEVDEIDFSGDTGKVHVSFRSTRHAGLAFDTLEGNAEPDKSGRLQKKVYLRSGDYVRVRKMTHPYQNRGRSPSKTPKKN